MPIKFSKMSFILTGATLGLVSGILWFKIGEIFDNYTGNFIAWFVMPAILPLLVAGVNLLIKFSRKNLIMSTVFVAVYYGCHWIPIGLLLLYCIIFNLSF